jgi:hypothetical protein
VPFGGYPSRGDEIHGDVVRAELASPGAGLAELSGFSSYVISKSWIAELDDFAADLDDAAETTGAHSGKHGLGEEKGRFDEELELIEVRLPGLFFDGQHGLVAGGVEDKNFDGTEGGLDLVDKPGDSGRVANVSPERLGSEAASVELVTELVGAVPIGKEVDGDGVTAFGQGRGHSGAKTTGGSGDESGSRHGCSVAEGLSVNRSRLAVT